MLAMDEMDQMALPGTDNIKVEGMAEQQPQPAKVEVDPTAEEEEELAAMMAL